MPTSASSSIVRSRAGTMRDALMRAQLLLDLPTDVYTGVSAVIGS